ncbi:cytochrome c [Flavobacteriaceae bacterium XHP0103]|uniref:c-type cytochrome n=1 Tax=Marixanthotalea marina TaxID=2844359 RepID=UPI002989A27F|nr:cytochrome c [Marixanthotalea marina]MBU3822649.1 cytochrome c [Marixanthotalea marina]
MKIIASFCLLFLSGLFVSAFGQDKALEESIKRGSEIYQDFCITCHMVNGEGVAGSFPPLAKSDFLMKNREKSIRAIKYGMQGEIIVNGNTYNRIMANLGLLESEVADVMNYITNSWGNTNDKIVTEAEVLEIKK